ncbi:transketolase family protein [Christensenella hongkongensis]|uniref:Transketolase, C-terminal section n=1 Tax=Christensenella hongkongensis TaxID=270498 RepID=A0A0M2NLS3_9FIRM|nr:transketolase C-terminal domain-containing protein [Christensenella hongkongensis]KKI51931.1 Transketolase, C-terminal section [Christensenella hongkongensis]TCW24529.1 transketolase subunit B [Christensenella hongkongensis]
MTAKACRVAFSEALLERARQDSNIVVVATDSRGSAAIGAFADELPEQFVEVGIAEQNAVGIAAGLAASGKQAFAIGPASFYSMRAAEQVKVDVAYSNVNVKIVGISGGISYGALGATHHSVQDIALMRAIPGIDVILPADANQTETLVAKLLDNPRPAYIRIGRGAVNAVYEKNPGCSIGKANILCEGGDIAILACGETLWYAIEAANILAQEGIHATVMDLFSVKPIDREAVIDAAKKCGRILTVEEHSIYGGLGGTVSEILSQECPVPMKILGLPDTHLINGSSQYLYGYYGLDAEGIARGAKALLAERDGR